jgi:hypothetical protein
MLLNAEIFHACRVPLRDLIGNISRHGQGACLQVRWTMPRLEKIDRMPSIEDRRGIKLKSLYT